MLRRLSKQIVDAVDVSKLSYTPMGPLEEVSDTYGKFSPPMPVPSGAIDAARLANFVSDLIADKVDDSPLKHLCVKIVGSVELINPKEFVSLWLPFLENLVQVLEKHRIPLSAPRYRHVFAAIIEAYAFRCVGRRPSSWRLHVAIPFQCRPCAKLNEFLGQPEATIITLRGLNEVAVTHINNFVTHYAAQIRCELRCAYGDLHVRKHLGNEAAKWVEKRDKARVELAKLQSWKLQIILGDEFASIMNFELLELIEPAVDTGPVQSTNKIPPAPAQTQSVPLHRQVTLPSQTPAMLAALHTQHYPYPPSTTASSSFTATSTLSQAQPYLYAPKITRPHTQTNATLQPLKTPSEMSQSTAVRPQASLPAQIKGSLPKQTLSTSLRGNGFPKNAREYDSPLGSRRSNSQPYLSNSLYHTPKPPPSTAPPPQTTNTPSFRTFSTEHTAIIPASLHHHKHTPEQIANRVKASWVVLSERQKEAWEKKAKRSSAKPTPPSSACKADTSTGTSALSSLGTLKGARTASQAINAQLSGNLRISLNTGRGANSASASLFAAAEKQSRLVAAPSSPLSRHLAPISPNRVSKGPTSVKVRPPVKAPPRGVKRKVAEVIDLTGDSD